ncbi:FeoB-associated Cys-rich membrane protein [Clostridium sp. ZS2-4]|uniref:FeoB-associated Cys-rich membrane protein n=1 Tax=Clostridium sp. ZS2-4 TaxID=2987703 RepID=UPI00227B9373|nr:FeoB-associated Cys-rich membrane protein [Clostridium sp. ZS2-4]MCY6355057.1 FeoB-associated Cys-rich membrane protein [Clostridium sp. ZS2-4]
MFEIFITILIVALSAFILIRSAKKKISGKCDCGSCSSHCPMYKESKEENSDKEI